MMRHQGTEGFTIVELMVTLAVAAILIGVALPAFTDFIRQRHLTSEVNDFVLALTYARSEAVRRGDEVRLEATGSDDDNEWGEGYQVVDKDGNTLRTFAPLAGNATTFDAQDALDHKHALTFSGRGMIKPPLAGPSKVWLCNTDTSPDRVVTVSVIGQVDVDVKDCP